MEKRRGGKRKGGHEREMDSKRRALEKEGAKCHKLTDLMFRPPPLPPVPSSVSSRDDSDTAPASKFINATNACQTPPEASPEVNI